MLQGCIKRDGLRKLIKIDDSLKKDKYIPFLKEHLIDLDDGKIFQHYRRPYHILHVTQLKLTDECFTALKDWSDQSPDLNNASNVAGSNE